MSIYALAENARARVRLRAQAERYKRWRELLASRSACRCPRRAYARANSLLA
jgi:hypothetical protein